MKLIEKIETEVKIGKVVDEEGVLSLVEFDKDGNEVAKFEITDLFERYVDKEFVTLKINYAKEI